MKVQAAEKNPGLSIRFEALDQLKLKEEEEKKDQNGHKVTGFNLAAVQKPAKLYRHDKIVAHGSFGIVYRATRANTDETVAIKRVYQDSRYKNRELDVLKLVSKYYDNISENRSSDTTLHPNILLMRHYFLDVDLN